MSTIRWSVQFPDSMPDAWNAFLGKHCIGRVLQRDRDAAVACGENPDDWHFEVDLMPRVRSLPGHGSRRSREKAKEAVEKIVVRWLAEAGLENHSNAASDPSTK